MDHVKVNRRLGQGAFGLVFRGSLKRLPGGKKGPVSVAVKTLRGKFGILFQFILIKHLTEILFAGLCFGVLFGRRQC